MSICYPDYRLASGWNVPLANLQNLVTLIQGITGKLLLIAPNSQPVNPFPVETAVGSGRVAGDGKPGHEWMISGVRVTFVNYLYANYLTTLGSLVNSKEVTIYTPVFDVSDGIYQRYNAYLVKPRPGEDFFYTRKHVIDLRLRFTHLTAI